MKSTQYSEKVLDHFRNPRNVGVLEGENVAVGKVGNPVCGDLMEVYIKVENDRIVDAKFRTFGCGSAIATSSMTTELVKGMTLDEAMKVTRKDVADELDGLPPIKMHCSNLAADALHEAIKNYRAMQKKGKTEEKKEETFITEIKGKDEFVGKGVYLTAENPEEFRGKRVLVVYTGEESIKTAIELTKVTNRVVLIASQKEFSENEQLLAALRDSKVRVITGGEVVEVMGEDDEVEKVRIHDLDEDDEYTLVVDAVIILE